MCGNVFSVLWNCPVNTACKSIQLPSAHFLRFIFNKWNSKTKKNKMKLWNGKGKWSSEKWIDDFFLFLCSFVLVCFSFLFFLFFFFFCWQMTCVLSVCEGVWSGKHYCHFYGLNFFSPSSSCRRVSPATVVRCGRHFVSSPKMLAIQLNGRRKEKEIWWKWHRSKRKKQGEKNK